VVYQSVCNVICHLRCGQRGTTCARHITLDWIGLAAPLWFWCRRARRTSRRRWVRVYRAYRRHERSVTAWWTRWVMSIHTHEVFLIVWTLIAGRPLYHYTNDKLESIRSRTRNYSVLSTHIRFQLYSESYITLKLLIVSCTTSSYSWNIWLVMLMELN